MNDRKPLNGEKTRSLTYYAKTVLWELQRFGVKPRQEFNPGVVDRLLREDLVKVVERPSPYKKHKPGALISFLCITEAGIQQLDKK